MPNAVAAATQSMIENLKAKTGKSLNDWVKIANSAGLAKHAEIVKFLKEKHGLGHGYANLVTHEALGAAMSKPAEGDDLVAAMFAADKAGLKPIYDKLLAAIQKLGPDVEVSPKKTYVSLRRKKQFALIQPTTKTRLDVGIQLKGEKPTARLEASGSFNAMVSHRVRVEKAADVDAELLGWLKAAYAAG